MDVPNSSAFAPGVVAATDSNERVAAPFPVGGETAMRRVKSWVMLWLTLLEPTSTVGARPTTTISVRLQRLREQLDVDADGRPGADRDPAARVA